jgi:hypothetical protein
MLVHHSPFSFFSFASLRTRACTHNTRTAHHIHNSPGTNPVLSRTIASKRARVAFSSSNRRFSASSASLASTSAFLRANTRSCAGTRDDSYQNTKTTRANKNVKRATMDIVSVPVLGATSRERPSSAPKPLLQPRLGLQPASLFPQARGCCAPPTTRQHHSPSHHTNSERPCRRTRNNKPPS